MKFIKKNKYTIIIMIAFIIVMFLAGFLKNKLVPDEGKAVYGTRLDGIEKYKLSDADLIKIGEELKNNENVVNVTNKVHGKIINFMITVNDSVDIPSAKVIANSIIPMFQNDELSYYSLQVYVLKNDLSLNNFPIVGYKGTKTSELVFTNDREITSEEENEE